MKFYRCKHCGNLMTVLYDGSVTPQCCGDDMELLKAGVTDGAREKHVPVIERSGDSVIIKVGSEPHPMLPEHYIEWIAIEANNKVQITWLKPGDKPEASFVVIDDAPITAYEYCNLHGLWQSSESEK